MLFISHVANADGDIAVAFSDWIKAAYTARHVNVFVSSATSIAPGRIPSDEILKNLKTANLMILLLSPSAKGNTWLAFETGAMIARDITVIPLLCRGATATDFPGPFQTMMQLFDVSDEDKFETAIGQLDSGIGEPKKKASSDLRKRLMNRRINLMNHTMDIAQENLRKHMDRQMQTQSIREVIREELRRSK